MKASLVTKKEKEREFLEQLLDGGKLKNYTIPVPINAELRKYQQVKINKAVVSIYQLYKFYRVTGIVL